MDDKTIAVHVDESLHVHAHKPPTRSRWAAMATAGRPNRARAA
jgi:hypothetical protein